MSPRNSCDASIPAATSASLSHSATATTHTFLARSSDAHGSFNATARSPWAMSPRQTPTIAAASSAGTDCQDCAAGLTTATKNSAAASATAESSATKASNAPTTSPRLDCPS